MLTGKIFLCWAKAWNEIWRRDGKLFTQTTSIWADLIKCVITTERQLEPTLHLDDLIWCFEPKNLGITRTLTSKKKIFWGYIESLTSGLLDAKFNKIRGQIWNLNRADKRNTKTCIKTFTELIPKIATFITDFNAVRDVKKETDYKSKFKKMAVNYREVQIRISEWLLTDPERRTWLRYEEQSMNRLNACWIIIFF